MSVIYKKYSKAKYFLLAVQNAMQKIKNGETDKIYEYLLEDKDRLYLTNNLFNWESKTDLYFGSCVCLLDMGTYITQHIKMADNKTYLMETYRPLDCMTNKDDYALISFIKNLDYMLSACKSPLYRYGFDYYIDKVRDYITTKDN